MKLNVRCAICGKFFPLQENTTSCTASIRKHAVVAGDLTVQFPGIRFTIYFCPRHNRDEEAQENALDVVEAGILEALRWRRIQGRLEPVIVR